MMGSSILDSESANSEGAEEDEGAALKEVLHGAAKKVAMHVHCPMVGYPLVQEVLNHAIGLGVNDEGEGHSG